MFFAMSRFRIANGIVAAVHEAFRNQPHLADQAPGFVRMDVISTKGCPEEIRLITFWTKDSFAARLPGEDAKAVVAELNSAMTALLDPADTRFCVSNVSGRDSGRRRSRRSPGR